LGKFNQIQHSITNKNFEKQAIRVTPVSPSQKILPGSLALVLLMGATKWGSYIGFGGWVFATDLLILGAFATMALRDLIGRTGNKFRHDPGIDHLSKSSTVSLFFLLLYVSIRAFTSVFDAETLALLVRDVAPYLYGIVALMSLSGESRSKSRRDKTALVLEKALSFHLAWVLLALLVTGYQGVLIPTPFTPMPIFQTRPDADGAFIMVLVLIKLRRIVYDLEAWPKNLIYIFGGISAILFMSSRAGLIALLLGLLVFVSIRKASKIAKVGQRGRRSRLMAAIMLPVLIGGLSLGAGERLSGWLNPGSNQSTAVQNAQGTSEARQAGWTGVINWTSANLIREFVGGGFGNNYLEESGVLQIYEGTDYSNVRSAHNWLVGSYARLGLIGILAIVAFLINLLRKIWTLRRTFLSDNLTFMALFVCLGVFTVSMFGVVLESPFGSVPFFWMAGLLIRSNPDGFSTSRVLGR